MTLGQPHELTWGSLVIDSEVEPDVPWRCEMLAVDADFGSPEPLVVEVQSWLDTPLLAITGWETREVTVRVRLSAFDGQALAQAEAAFMAEVQAEQLAPLIRTPPTVDAWPMVFDVLLAKLGVDYDDGWDLDETYRHCYYFTLTFMCSPWVRDLETTIIPALPVPEDPDTPEDYQTISDVSGTSDWSPAICHPGHFTGLTEDSGTDSHGTYYRAYAYDNYLNSTGFIVAIRTAATSLAGFPYLTVDVELTSNPANGGTPYIRVSNATGMPLTAPVAQRALSATVRRYYFEGLPNSIANLRVSSWWPVTTAHATRRMKIYEIGRSDRIEVDGSNGFQVARTATVSGTAPTTGALRFDAGTGQLLESSGLVYTGPSPVIPLRTFRHTSSTVDVDTTMISGARNTLAAPSVFLVPVAQLRFSTYSVLARLEFTGSKIISWQARVVAEDGTDIPGSEVVVAGETLVKNDTAAAWRIHHLDAVQMPVVSIEGATTHAVEVTLSMGTGGAGVQIDEGWLVDTKNGGVTVIHQPSAFDLAKIELRSPQVNAPRPAVVGTWLTHGTQDISRLVTVFGTHRLKPGLVHVFTACDKAKYAACEVEFFPRYHTHPGPALPAGAA